MRIIITCLLLTSLCINSVAQIDTMEVSLLNLEREIFLAPNANSRNELRIRKACYLLGAKDYSIRTWQEFQRVDTKIITDSVTKANFYWNMALLSMINDKRDYGLFSLERYLDVTHDSADTEVLLLSVLLNKDWDSARVNNCIVSLIGIDSAFVYLRCLSNLEKEIEVKNKNLYLVSSAVIPGSGTMAAGYPVKGLTSLAINSGVGGLVWFLANKHMYINLILTGGALIQKFYLGNIRLTKKLIQDKELERFNALNNGCKKIFQDILFKYPLKFKKV